MALEAWQSGPLAGVSPLLMPAAHAVVQARADIAEHAAGLRVEGLWLEPHGAASCGFHLRHISGSIDRLLTYAKGQTLTAEQFQFLKSEREPGEPPEEAESLIAAAAAQVDEMMRLIRATPDESLFEERFVGRARLKTNVFGLLFHTAEHTQRHTGQLITTAKIVRGLGAALGEKNWREDGGA
jgi:uncharacterized damage-inducible protein DinB